MLPSLGEAIGLPGDLVQEVPVRARGDAAEDVWRLGGDLDLPWLRQGGPPHVGGLGEEGVHLGGHLPPGPRGVGVGGRPALRSMAFGEKHYSIAFGGKCGTNYLHDAVKNMQQ